MDSHTASALLADPFKVLLVEDHMGDAVLVQTLLEEAGHNSFYITHVGALRSAVTKLQECKFDLVLLDLSLPDSTGMDTVRAFVEKAPDVPIVVLSGSEREELALAAIRHGVQDYLIKGQIDGSALAKTMMFAIERNRSDVGNRIASETRHRTLEFPEGEQIPDSIQQNLIGRSLAIQQVRQVICKVGMADATVLITGETGTGKELVAQALHETGPRRKNPFVAVNCGSIPETLLESILFGHAKGSFTGADKDKQGFFEVAKFGTLFLDEIGELPVSLQPKILRALEKREVLPVGKTTPVPISARIIAATNRDLPDMIRQGQFRQDLYYRLNVIEIRIPPLRERVEDIGDIAHFLLAKHCQQTQRPVPALTPEILCALEGYDWPGNVREMSNVLERLLLLSEGPVIVAADLPIAGIKGHQLNCDDLKTARQIFEREHILHVIAKFSGSKEQAAKALGIDLSSLYRKLRE